MNQNYYQFHCEIEQNPLRQHRDYIRKVMLLAAATKTRGDSSRNYHLLDYFDFGR